VCIFLPDGGTFCRGSNDSDDLVQETLLKGLPKIHQFTAGTRDFHDNERRNAP
jgi:hypothetical protein